MMNCKELNCPKVSVIMPVYMAEDYLEKSITSVINQTYKNIELICIDDASRDNSYKICEGLQSKYSNIRLYRNVNENGEVASCNLGQEATRNLGLRMAEGEYFIFLDADDAIEPETIEKCVAIAEDTNVDVVMFSFSAVTQDIENPELSHLKNGLYTMKDFSKYLLKEISWSIISCIGSKLYRMRIVQDNDIHFDIKYKHNEDCAFALEYLLHANNLYYLDEPYYKYLIRQNSSVMSSYREGMFITNVRVVEIAKKIFLKNNCLEGKEKDYYIRLLYLITDSLINEFKFGTKQSLVSLVNTISCYNDFENIYRCVVNQWSYASWRNILIRAIKNQHYIIIRLLLSIRHIMKKKTLYAELINRTLGRLIKKAYSIGLKNPEYSRIYMFHNIVDGHTDRSRFCSNYKTFEMFVKDELKKRSPLALSDILKHGSSFCITFDDGYSGVYKYAYPILKKLDVPFTVFVTEGWIDSDGYLTSEEIVELNQDPICIIASHTKTHPMLRFCAESDSEICNSAKSLSSWFDIPIRHFAYPYGSVYACSYRNIRMVKNGNYELACSAITGVLNPFARLCKFFLPRINGDDLVMEIEREESLKTNAKLDNTESVS